MPVEPADEDDVVRRAASAGSLYQLGQVLRHLKRREARQRQGPELTHRQIARRTGWSVASVTYYLNGSVLPPIDRFDELVRVLGATLEERTALAVARDRLAESRRPRAGLDEASVGSGSGPGARTLPAPPTMFVGRAELLARLDRTLVGRHSSRPVTVMSGLPGVGKTALALHWAYRSMRHFPDGQLYVNLRGFDPRDCLSADEALHLLLTALGVGPTDAPSSDAMRRTRYREMLTGRRMLVLLDNAADADQVRPLLPPPPCVALVTSRSRLDGGSIAAELQHMHVDVLTEDEAVLLLRRMVGSRCDREPEAVRVLAVRCGHMPLALRVAAELAVARPWLTLGELGDELAAVGELEAFATGDVRSDVRAVFSWSLRSMPRPAVRAFHMLGLAPGETIDTWALAALAEFDAGEARSLLDALAQAHLIEAVRLDRYTMNDLVRAYAIELAEQELDPADRQAALHRLLDYYVAGAAAAVEAEFGPQRTYRPRSYPQPVAPVHLPDLSSRQRARAWLGAEQRALVRVCAMAESLGLPRHAVALATVLRLPLDNGYDRDALTVHAAALAASARLGSAVHPADRADASANVGVAHLRLGQLADAELHLERAVAEYTDLNDPRGLVRCASALGNLRRRQGRLRDALVSQRRALDTARAAGLHPSSAIQALNTAAVYLALEQPEQGVRLCQAGIEELAKDSMPHPLAYGHAVLALCLARLHRAAEAVEHATEGLALARSVGQLDIQVLANIALGSAERGLGRLDVAMEHLEEALRIARELGRCDLIVNVLNSVGETHLAAAAAASARDSHAEALELASQDGYLPEAARSLLGLGDAHAALGDPATADTFWRRSLAAYTDLGLPTDEIRARLDSSLI